MASCELPGLPGQQHGKIRLGTMLHELSVLFHIGLFFQSPKFVKKAKFEKLGKWSYFWAMEWPKVLFQKKGKVSRLPYLVPVST